MTSSIQYCPIHSSHFGTSYSKPSHHASICNAWWHTLKLCRCVPRFCSNYGNISKYPFLYGHLECLKKQKFTEYQIWWVGRVWKDSHLFLVKSMHKVVLDPGGLLHLGAHILRTRQSAGWQHNSNLGYANFHGSTLLWCWTIQNSDAV